VQLVQSNAAWNQQSPPKTGGWMFLQGYSQPEDRLTWRGRQPV